MTHHMAGTSWGERGTGHAGGFYHYMWFWGLEFEWGERDQNGKKKNPSRGQEKKKRPKWPAIPTRGSFLG